MTATFVSSPSAPASAHPASMSPLPASADDLARLLPLDFQLSLLRDVSALKVADQAPATYKIESPSSSETSPSCSPSPSPTPSAFARLPRRRLVETELDEDEDDEETGLSRPTVLSGPIRHVFKSEIAKVDLDGCDAHGENAFFVCDLAQVYRQHERWMRELGHRVTPFFAVKCNPDPFVLQLLASLGCGFDCASQPEISAVLSLPGHVAPQRIIYANPCKAPSFIRHAARNGVDHMTFDNADELAKIKRHHPGARLVLRILTDDSGSLCRFGIKFGAPLEDVRALLVRARELDLDVVGVSFHVGSGCSNPDLYEDAVRRARWTFDVAREELGKSLELIDVGGGFEDASLEGIAAVLRPALEKYFPASEGVRVIAEPGRYYVAGAFELATNIIARRGAGNIEGAKTMYYINDGVYGAFNCIMFDHQVVHPRVLTRGGEFVENDDDDAVAAAGPMESCSIWGPTCDSIDVISMDAALPSAALRVGDWLRWTRMGAYTICAASQFNGFRRSKVRYTIDARGDVALERRLRALLVCDTEKA